MEAEVASALQRWREVTAPLDHARVERDAQLMATPLRRLVASPPRKKTESENEPETTDINTGRAWSHADFLRRVASFGVATWFAKPLCISPLVCARFGWVNTASDRLQCRHCERVLCFAIDATLSARGAEAVAEKFASQLESGHAATCPWSHNASPASFTVLPLLGPSQVAQGLWERIETLLAKATNDAAVKQALTEMQLDPNTMAKLLNGTKYDEKTLVDVVAKRWADTTASDAVDARVALHAAVLSACGWIVQHQHDTAVSVVVSCEYCNRHVPIVASKKTNDVTQASEETPDEETKGSEDAAPPAKRQRVSSSPACKPMDPITAHRWFCPWVVAQRHQDAQHGDHKHGDSQNKSLDDFITLPGWRQCALALSHLHASSDPTTRHTPTTPSQLTPFDSLAVVQSVLALSDTSNY